jgi:diguanylate cyclase (GGDEF)-like protein/PAS domain S-box-containing protein
MELVPLPTTTSPSGWEAGERFRRAFEDAAIGMALTTLDGRWIEVNQALAAMLGYERGELQGRPFSELTYGPDRLQDERAIRELIAGWRRSHHSEKRYLHRTGRVVWGALTVSAIRGEDGRPHSFISQIQDITERKQADQELQRLALHDSLTGLPNREMLLRRLRSRIEHDRTSGLIFFDLDRFKRVNDELGHAVGDQLLTCVAWRLRGHLRQGDLLARYAGDEFVLLAGCDGTDLAALNSMADRIVDVLTQPFSLAGQRIYLGASVGVAHTDQTGMDADALLRAADTAMYEAKHRGGAGVITFGLGSQEAESHLVTLETELRQAIDGDQLVCHYQPQYHLPGLELVGVEALVRWQHPERGLLGPGEFIAVAEQSGLIQDLGLWVIEHAIEQADRWCVDHARELPLRVAVNVSPRQLQSSPERLIATLRDALRSSCRPLEICVEITETAIVDDPALAAEVMDQLKRLGVKLALDDFGAGQSSLSHFQLLDLDLLKLDRSFLLAGNQDKVDWRLLHGLVDLGHRVGAQVLAEGIETATQLEAVGRTGCDEVQGFHLGRPTTAQGIGNLLAASR